MPKRLLFVLGLVLLILSLSTLLIVRLLPPETVTKLDACDWMWNSYPLPAGYWYQVQAGDTWDGISRRSGISVEALWGANPRLHRDNRQLYPGEWMMIPCCTEWIPTPHRIVEVKYPAEMNIGESYHIRLSLISVRGEIYTPTVEIKYRIEEATPEPVGTPHVPLEEQFGEQYELVTAMCNMTAINFDHKLVDKEAKSITDRIDWKWSVKPKDEAKGNQEVTLTLSMRWKPKDEKLPGEKERDIWQTQLLIPVQKPWLTMGQVSILAVLSTLVGPALQIPWLYEKIMERREKRRKEEESKPKIYLP